MKKILITGGNGFLAQNFLENLKGDYQIISCNRSQLDLSDSVAVYAYLKKSRFDVILHTATYDAAPKDSPNDPNKVLENNLIMFFNLARCKDYFGKMLFFGSGAEFSREHWVPEMTEAYFDKFVPSDQYGFSKYVMTQYALTTNNIFNLRLFGVFGKYDDWRYRFIPNICCHALSGMSISVHSNAKADFLFIDDLVIIVKWFIENRPLHQVYNVCSGRTYEYVELAKMVNKLAETHLEVNVKNPLIQKHYSASNALLMKELDRFEFTPMEMALKLLYNWHRKNKHIIDVSKFHF